MPLSKTQIEELLRLIADSGVSRTDIELEFDDLVHEAKSTEASLIDNAGLSAQIGYLYDDFSTAKSAVEEVIAGLMH